MAKESEIIFYQGEDGNIKIEVLFRDETFWMTQKKLSELFDVQRPAITKHLKNIFESGELEEKSVSSIMEHTAEDNLLIQSYFTTAFLLELKNKDFLNSDYYKNASFEDKFVKESLPKVGIDNQGTLLMMLYTMLVVPKQLLEKDFPVEFEALNGKVKKN